MDALLALGVREVPVVSRAREWISGQVLKDIAWFVGIDMSGTKMLPPGELHQRMNVILIGAQRFLRQFPDELLNTEVPNRPRSYRALGHHLFRIPEAFLELTTGKPLTHGALADNPPDDMRSFAAIADYGAEVLARANAWWETARDSEDFTRKVETYYGMQPLQEVMERTIWHSGQHVRQFMMLMELHGIEPDGWLGDEAFKDLPMPKEVWDG